jgi:hypothetical protein
MVVIATLKNVPTDRKYILFRGDGAFTLNRSGKKACNCFEIKRPFKTLGTINHLREVFFGSSYCLKVYSYQKA